MGSGGGGAAARAAACLLLLAAVAPLLAAAVGDPCADACQSLELAQPKSPETDTSTALSDILLQVVDAANYVITDVPFINIGVMVLRGTIDRLNSGDDIYTQGKWLQYNLQRDIKQLQDWLGCRLDGLAHDIMYRQDQLMKEDKLESFNAAIRAIQRRIDEDCALQNCIAARNLPPSQRNADGTCAQPVGGPVARCRMAPAWDPARPVSCTIDGDSAVGICDPGDGRCYQVTKHADWVAALRSVLDIFATHPGINNFENFESWMDIRATIALAKGAALKLLVMQQLVMADGTRGEGGALKAFAREMATQLTRRLHFHLDRANLEKVVRANTYPTNDTWTTEMDAVRFPAYTHPNFSTCRFNTPIVGPISGIQVNMMCSISERIVLTQMVRWSCEKSEQFERVWQCPLPKTGCDGRMSSALRKKSDCNGNWFHCGWISQKAGVHEENANCPDAYKKCINDRTDGQIDFDTVYKTKCVFAEQTRTGINDGIDKLSAAMNTALEDVKQIVLQFRKLANSTSNGVPKNGAGWWRTNPPPILNCEGAVSLVLANRACTKPRRSARFADEPSRLVRRATTYAACCKACRTSTGCVRFSVSARGCAIYRTKPRKQTVRAAGHIAGYYVRRQP